MIKRFLDIVLSLAVLLILMPLLLATATALAFETGFPVIFRQKRVGIGGKCFVMYKFRSMVKNASAIGPYYTSADDRRITRVGRFVRRASIDELPQLLNVLKGDMSLVGPRPDVPEQRSQYSDYAFSQRCSIRPGITGLAQVQLRSSGSECDRLSLDLYYVRERSLWLDLKIILRTCKRISGRGAN